MQYPAHAEQHCPHGRQISLQSCSQDGNERSRKHLHVIQTDNNVQHSPSTSQTFLQQLLSVLIVQQKQHIASSTKPPITSTSAIMDIFGTVSAK